MKNRYLFQGGSTQASDEILSQDEEHEEEESVDEEERINKNFQTIVLGLFELSAFDNYKLLNSSLSMLKAMFEQRKDLIANFKKVLICGKGNL